jgi:hypothetical protein
MSRSPRLDTVQVGSFFGGECLTSLPTFWERKDIEEYDRTTYLA